MMMSRPQATPIEACAQAAVEQHLAEARGTLQPQA
jgi:hypothetical protein